MAFVVQNTHTSPTVLSRLQAKRQLNFNSPAEAHEDDDLIDEIIDEAISVAESIINSEIKEKVFTVTGKSFADVLSFKKQIITSVETFTYKDANGSVQTVPSANYSLQSVDKYENKIEFTEDYELPEVKEYDPAAVTLQVKVGYADGKTPKSIIKALKLLVTHFYEYRSDSIKEKTTAAEIILQPYRRY